MFANLYSESIKPKPEFSNKTLENYPIKEKKGICICVIGKNENLYVREFIDYYKLLKVNKIIIFDNNDINGEKFDTIIKDFIEEKIVEIIDVRGLLSIQIPIYNYYIIKLFITFNNRLWKLKTNLTLFLL